jgi:hypothetical protein
MLSHGNARKNGQPIVGFAFTTMLQATGWCLSRILSTEKCDNTEASLILSWPGRSWFYVFPRLKSALKEWSFCDATDIIKNATEELKRLSRKGFQECFQHIYSRWQKCIVAERYYFEGDVAEVIVLLCITQNILKFHLSEGSPLSPFLFLIQVLWAPSCVAEWLADLSTFTLA